ncbi:hypothetical protein [Flagellimonas iocasae]|uniref:RiboL-PSP-HEPN domain-containing protein n=1 Tax=Flagellimonas iocasae TaxID=2055905 RepID=A0ABW4XZ45_9FLAO
MSNTYRNYLDIFFEKLLYYRHISSRVNKVFQNDIQLYTSEKASMHFASALIISDWTAPSDNGWEINFHTGLTKQTNKYNYKSEIEKVYSRQLCLLYAQSFESFERLLKDCLYDRLNRDEIIKEYANKLLPKNQIPLNSRKKMPGRENLFKILKRAGGKTFKDFTLKNNPNIRFNELWKILSAVRHSITHNESNIEKSLIKKSDHHFEIFNLLFHSQNISDEFLLVTLDYKKFETLLKRFAEFAFQVFKSLSIEENLEWDIRA